MPGPFVVMVLYIIGLGLGDEKDITVRGLECIQRSSGVYLEVCNDVPQAQQNSHLL